MRFINLGFVFLIVISVNCQENSSPLAGYDYILRSCISTAELIRTHRKAGKIEKMIVTNNVAEPSEVKNPFRPINGPGKKRKIEETPLRTLSIRRSSKSSSPLIFMRKGSFPEVPEMRNRQQKGQRESEVIIIKPKD